MLDDRKAKILRAIVEAYIETAQPVGSGAIAAAPGVEVSSATVRNEMAVLERDGYLAQPHTSAGRIPTDKGYRFFVDSILPTGELGTEQRQQVRRFFDRTHGAIESLLHETSRLLAGLTDCTAVVVGPAHEAATLRSVQLVPLGGRMVLLVGVLSTGAIEKRAMEMRDGADGVDEGRIAAASAHLAAHLVGRTLDDLGDVPATGDEKVDSLTSLAVGALGGTHDDEDGQVFVGGAAKLAASFDAVDTVRQVLSILEQQYVVVTLLRDVLDRGLSVAIGAEHGVEPLAECALVVAPYEAEGTSGTIGLVGPTRMKYPQAIAAVSLVSERLGRRLREG